MRKPLTKLRSEHQRFPNKQQDGTTMVNAKHPQAYPVTATTPGYYRLACAVRGGLA